jgi:hypothetical protein
MDSNNAPSATTTGSAQLQRKILLATQIMLKEMALQKKEAILNFLKGMVALDEAEEQLYDERMAELKQLLAMENADGLKKRNPEV